MKPTDFLTAEAMHALARRHRFEIIPVAQRAQHMPPGVAAELPVDHCVVFPVADEHSDTAAFSAHFGFGLEDCANTLVLRYTKDQAEHYAAVVSLGSLRLDVNGAVKAFLGAKRLSFARREVATELTGMEFGGITAFGLPPDMRILVDAAVMGRPYVVVGAGYRRTKILLAPALLSRLPRVDVAALTFAQS
jgi:prolyl-tRNA editing enzyme YbaK/EbsC (Cys-tRNA(Pro) deacylase)